MQDRAWQTGRAGDTEADKRHFLQYPVCGQAADGILPGIRVFIFFLIVARTVNHHFAVTNPGAHVSAEMEHWSPHQDREFRSGQTASVANFLSSAKVCPSYRDALDLAGHRPAFFITPWRPSGGSALGLGSSALD